MLRVARQLKFCGLGFYLVAALVTGAGASRADDSEYTPLHRRIDTSTKETNAKPSSVEDSDFVTARRWVFRQLLSPRPAGKPEIIMGAAIVGPNPGPTRDGSGLVIRIADADPNFSMWQKNAQDRLKEEMAPAAGPEHPLAMAHPDDFVIICEAGCRDKDSPDHIVYMVSKTAAATGLSSTRKMEPTAGELPASSDAKPKTGDIVGDQNVIMCVAGCYESPKEYRSGPAVREHAKAAKADLVKVASLDEKVLPAARPALTPVKLRIQKIASLHAALKRQRPAKITLRKGWRVTVVKTEPQATHHELTRPKHLAHIQQLKASSASRHKIAKASARLLR